jgi:glycosyltransferase involved in cell wall biosynthesis
VSNVSVSVVVPIHNEHELCEPSLRTIHDFMTRNVADFEIIVIESGSTDGTAALCDKAAAELPHVRVIHEEKRNGMGAALRLGYADATKDYVWLVTVDLPFPIETLLEARPLLTTHDCVLSYRAEDKRRLPRLIQSAAYATLIKTMLNLPMRSVNSAFKVLPRAFVVRLPLVSRGWFLDAEILYWIARERLHYAELPVPLIERTAGQSSVGAMDWVKVFGELFAFRRELRLREARS